VRSLFLSDLHLDERHPSVIERFVQLMHGAAANADAVYILGDLFELWIGDDCIAPALRCVPDALRALGEGGTRVSVMRGNRDFLLGEAFARSAGCELIDDPLLIELGGEPALLCHGDMLCTDDNDYQSFRARVRDPDWQRGFLAKPVDERLTLARAARNMSREAVLEKPDVILDVNPDSVSRLMRAKGARTLIHGHTHRPALHRFDLEGLPARRLVLGDWPERATLLVAEGKRLSLETLDSLLS